MRASQALVASIATAALLAAPAVAQSPVYVQIDYIAVAPGDRVGYLALEREVWRAIHTERRRRGDLLDWALYDVRFAPAGTPYDLVTATVYADLPSAEAGDLRAAIAAAHPARDADSLLSQLDAAREVVHRELWALVTMRAPTGAVRADGRHLAVNYMAVPESGRADYFAIENDVWAPIHQVRADDGSMGGWSLYSLVLPRGAALAYQFKTVDYFNTLDDAAANITDQQIRRAHPTASQSQIDAMMDRTDAARAIVRTELWTRIWRLDPPEN